MTPKYVSIYSEFEKPFSGTEFQQGQAAMIRSVEAFLQKVDSGVSDLDQMRDWIKGNIENGYGELSILLSAWSFLHNVKTGLTDIKVMHDWLGRCFYAANMENFK